MMPRINVATELVATARGARGVIILGVIVKMLIVGAGVIGTVYGAHLAAG
jgi:hypothetical protein